MAIYLISSILLLIVSIILCYLSFAIKNRKLIIKNKLTLFAFIITILIFIVPHLFHNNELSFAPITPLDEVKNSAFSYASCMQNRIMKDDCDVMYSKLEASKAEAELSNKELSKINAAEKLGTYQAVSKFPNKSPYETITSELTSYPLFIIPTEDNYLMYKSCQSVDKPLYWIIGWHTKRPYNYIMVYKTSTCPNISDAVASKGLPYITEQQYENLKDGTYWRVQNSPYLPSASPSVIIVKDLYTTILQMDQKIDKQKKTDEDNEIPKPKTE